MATVLVLTGGGIKSAVAAARYARDHSLILLHLDHGQPSSAREHKALVGLMPTLPRARLMRLSLPRLEELNQSAVEHARPGIVRGGGGDGPSGEAANGDSGAGPRNEGALLPANVRGLFPVILSIGYQTAARVGAELIVVGLTRNGAAAHLGLGSGADTADARREFLHAYATACDVLPGMNRAIKLEAPLIDLTYPNLVQLGMRFEIPFENTWSCTSASARFCGKCESCRERAEAFAAIGRVDPLGGDAAAAVSARTR